MPFFRKQVCIFIVLISCSELCFSQAEKSDKLESKILACLKDLDSDYEGKLFEGLELFEKYLIESDYLSDNSAKSYYQIYKDISNGIETTFYRDYRKKSVLDDIEKEAFGSCYYRFRKTKVFKTSNSKYKKLTLYLENTPPSTEPVNLLQYVAKAYIETLDEADFSNVIFKYSTLFFIYNTSLDKALDN